MDASSFLVGSSFLNSANSITSSRAEAQAERMQADFQARQLAMNAKLAEIGAAEAIRRGKTQAETLGTQTKRLIGSQRAALAAQGIEVDSGSALNIQQSTQTMSALDRLAIEHNAAQEAWGLKVAALNYQTQSSFQTLSGQMQSRSTLLAGGMRALQGGLQGAYYYYGGASQPTSPGGGITVPTTLGAT